MLRYALAAFLIALLTLPSFNVSLDVLTMPPS